MGLARQIKRLKKRMAWSANKKRGRKVLLEPLEPRLLLSADLEFAMGGTVDDVTLRLQDVESVDTLQLINNDDLVRISGNCLVLERFQTLGNCLLRIVCRNDDRDLW